MGSFLPDGTNVNHELVKDGCAGGIGSMRQGIRCGKGSNCESPGMTRGLPMSSTT